LPWFEVEGTWSLCVVGTCGLEKKVVTGAVGYRYLFERPLCYIDATGFFCVDR